MKDMLFLGGILLAVFVAVPLINSLIQHIADTGGTVHHLPADPAHVDDPDDDERRTGSAMDWSDLDADSGISAFGKPKLGGALDEDGHY
jgi:hypothetical protein